MPPTTPDVVLLDLRTSAQQQLMDAQNVVERLQNALLALDNGQPAAAAESTPVVKRRRGMSAANRAAASKRMKAYWRKRRAGK